MLVEQLRNHAKFWLDSAAFYRVQATYGTDEQRAYDTREAERCEAEDAFWSARAARWEARDQETTLEEMEEV